MLKWIRVKSIERERGLSCLKLKQTNSQSNHREEFFFLDWHYKHENRETRSQTLIGNLSESESIRVVVVISNANIKIFLHGNFSLFKIKKVFDKILNNRIFQLNYLQMKLIVLNLFKKMRVLSAYRKNTNIKQINALENLN